MGESHNSATRVTLAHFVGVWESGKFEIPTAATLINSTTVLLLAGSAEQLKNYNEHFGGFQESGAPVLVLGGTRAGRAAAEALETEVSQSCTRPGPTW